MTSTAADFDEVDGETVSYITSSSYRKQILGSLSDRPKTPSTIATEHGTDMAHISRALQHLRDRDVVTLLVPEDTKKGRIYALTDDGADLVDVAGEMVSQVPPGGGDV